ncbi:DHA2 family efflux MFS transporter permease subunit [Paractinoplanes lichenicola]|uniref:DHA2 family efflux MFS transporter permease subunit n=1 Tax=Paractinoplanes lichenicola TaxID=2802976 RepID=A0ABS1VWD4_9ACTN|nr:DHA2 family efflux MFS transporter permease subunit [Actinoplanes lichenicola]MBL7258795.1 DHA2 family efflux MFS transporter permease subunit [Actinoplanes lichenicola]
MPVEEAGYRRWLGLVAIALGVAMIVVDTTIVNVITPAVIEDLGINSTQAQWIQESYAIVFAALLLIFGRVADLIGARRVFAVGVVVFGVTSLLAGLAPSGEVLILARFLQGVGGAMLLPTSLSLLNQTFRGKERGQAYAVWGSTIGAATAVGPVIGGWFAEHASWRWAFGINVPLVVLIFILTVVFITPSPRSAGRIDVPGALLSVAGLGALAYGLVEGRTYGWVTSIRGADVAGLSPVFLALIVAAVTLTLFVLRQIRLSRSGQPLMDTRLFRIASFRNGNLATVIIGLGEFGIVAVLPLWLQFTLGYSSLQAGAALVPLAIGSFVANGMSFGLAEKLSALSFVRLGLALEAAALAALAVVAATTSAPWWSIAIAMFVYGIGVGFATAQVTNVVLADVPPTEAGQGSGIQSTFRQLGSALGIAVLTTIFFSALGNQVKDTLTTNGQFPADQIDRYAATVTDSAGAAIAPLAADPATATVADAARTAMADGIALGSAIAAGLLLLGLVATLLIPATRRTRDEEPAPQEAEPVH